MGTFKFTWGHKADEVYVTGTFDNWSKSVRLDKVGDGFEKTVTLPDASEKILYKFVADETWLVDHTAPTETDVKGNVNNILTPDRIVKEDTPATAATMNTVTPESTTAQLAKDVPVESKEPIATPSGGPGGFPITPMNELDKSIGVNPMPAAEGAVNPVKLAPGEKPVQATEDEIQKNVKLDKESYENSDAIPGIGTLPPVSGNMIPESSLPISDGKDVATLNTVSPESTTAALAGKVPLEPKVPAVVKASQEEAEVDPEASAVAEEVKEKAEVEAELKKKVPEAPATTSNTTAATIASVTSTFTAAASAVVAMVPDSVKQSLPMAAQEALKTEPDVAKKEETRQEVAPAVPEPVKESLQEAGKEPEAAASTGAVEDKKKMEAELIKEVEKVPAEGESKKTEDEPSKKTEDVAPVPANGAGNGVGNGAESSTAEAKNGSSAAPVEAKNGSTSKTDAEKKKKNRLSTIFSKIKSKVSHKDKE